MLLLVTPLPDLGILAGLDACEYVPRVAGGEAAEQQEDLPVTIWRDGLEGADAQVKYVLQGCVTAGASWRATDQPGQNQSGGMLGIKWSASALTQPLAVPELLDLYLGAAREVRQRLGQSVPHDHETELAQGVLVEEIYKSS